jgi:hypothetical protein
MAGRGAAGTVLVLVGVLALVPSAAAAAHQPAVNLGVPEARQAVVPKVAHVRAATQAGITDPPANEDYSAAFIDACWLVQITPAEKTACDDAALKDFDAARAAEGLGPMTLPTNFDSITQAQQLLVLANIERVDRGLLPVSGLTSALNALANQGASSDDDPPFPSPFDGSAGSGNWAAGGHSTLFSEYLWEYDDGVGSGNLDCTLPGDAGCWGHRHDTLFAFDTPLVMGAAAVSDPKYGESLAEEFIGGYTNTASDPVVTPDWSSLVTYFPLGVGTSSLTVDPGDSATVKLWASGEDMPLSYSISGGSNAWSVSAGTCPSTLLAGHTCTLTVTNTDGTAGGDSGTLSVAGPNGGASVSLSVTQTTPAKAPAVSLRSSASSIGFGTAVALSGSVRSGGAGVESHAVALQRKAAGTSTWTTVSAGQTGAEGKATFSVTPDRIASYRLLSQAGEGWLEATSAPVAVSVASVVTLTASHPTIKVGRKETLRGKVRPNQAGEAVRLQQRVAGHWKTVSELTLSPRSTVVVTFVDPSKGTLRYRLRKASGVSQRGAHSAAVTITVR